MGIHYELTISIETKDYNFPEKGEVRTDPVWFTGKEVIFYGYPAIRLIIDHMFKDLANMEYTDIPCRYLLREIIAGETQTFIKFKLRDMDTGRSVIKWREDYKYKQLSYPDSEIRDIISELNLELKDKIEGTN